jgi:hypothetical protein
VISGGDTLEISPIDNKQFVQHGQRLIPIAMDYQIDNLYIRYMQRHLKPVLNGLHHLIFREKKEKRKECWYETFLTMLVLLCTLESVFDKQISFVKKYEGNVSGVPT